jgi:tight adherence protein C
MIFELVRLLTDKQVLFAIFAGVAAIATVITLAMPLLATDKLAARMKTAAIEREKIRARERARLAAEANRPVLRREAKAYMQNLVERFNLKAALSDEGTIAQLRMAGYRGQAPLTVFLFARFMLPIATFAIAFAYIFLVLDLKQPTIVKFGLSLFAAYAGFYAPLLYLRNVTQKRQQSMERAWPDALDLMLICVESGMSAEAAFRKVSEEIGNQSPFLAEELVLTTAELSYLQERRQAYENLGTRTGVEGIKNVMTALIQAEKYGTPIAASLRVMAQEQRDQRMNNAEKKAAALPPKLTVPMILFFLPVLFGVIIGPAVIKVMAANGTNQHGTTSGRHVN